MYLALSQSEMKRSGIELLGEIGGKEEEKEHDLHSAGGPSVLYSFQSIIFLTF